MLRKDTSQREALKCLGVAFGGDLDTSVRQIPDPAVQPFPRGCRFGEVSEADSLHAPADDVFPRDDHRRALSAISYRAIDRWT